MLLKTKISLAVLAFNLAGNSIFAYGREGLPSYHAIFGDGVRPIGRPLHLRLGKVMDGVLYTYDKYGLTNYESTYVSKGTKYTVVKENGEEAGHVNPISIFNIEYDGGFCITYINAHSNPWSSYVNYDGSVYCVYNGKILIREDLSRHLIGARDAEQAMLALKPFLQLPQLPN